MNATTETPSSTNGEVFTRRWVADFILDLIGYSPTADLCASVAVEPSCGSGAFVGPMVERLSQSLRTHGHDLDKASHSLQIFDLLPQHIATCREVALSTLVADGWSRTKSESIVGGWMEVGDFLLTVHEEGSADYVVGNPPYIRMDDMAPEIVARYKERCSTMSGRTDIYIGFFEIGLRMLRPAGALGFICADRWMRNQYGKGLRAMLSAEYSLETTVLAHDVDAFEEEVSAYPAITVIRKEAQRGTHLVDTTAAFSKADAKAVVGWLSEGGSEHMGSNFHAARLDSWNWGEQSWPSGSAAQLKLLQHLNERFRPLEDSATGTRIGIGVATGADDVFITTERLNIEKERLLPLVMAKDTKSGSVQWSGHYLVNPWDDTGQLVDLTQFPRLNNYLEANRNRIEKRNVAKRDRQRWFRTIDKVDPALVHKPKLLFPDMKMTTHPTLEPGGLYPHHNLYFVVSEVWDLEVLGGLLLSKVAEFFVSAYAVRMRGGTLRFQAQYLRRIRVPDPAEIDIASKQRLIAAFRQRDQKVATEVALSVYGLSEIPK